MTRQLDILIITGIEIPELHNETTIGNSHYAIFKDHKTIIGYMISKAPYNAMSIDGKIRVYSRSRQTVMILLWMALEIRNNQKDLDQTEP